MYGKKEGKFNVGKGTKNITRELDPKKFGIKQDKEKTLYQKEFRKDKNFSKSRRILQSIAIRGTLYSSGNSKFCITDKVNAMLKEFARLHVNLAYQPIHNIYDFYDETKNKKLTREKVTFYYIVEEDRVADVRSQLEKYMKYLESVELSSK